jgi:hypothetical protein
MGDSMDENELPDDQPVEDPLTVAANLARTLRLGLDIEAIITPLYDLARSRIIYLLQGLQDSGLDLSPIGDSDELRNYLFTILQNTIHEASRAKIGRWKDAVVHLATDFREFGFKDNFIRTLEDISELDITVLSFIYSMQFNHGNDLETKVKTYFEHCDVGPAITNQALKRLVSHALLDEQWSGFKLGASGQFYYAQNELGTEFLRFISTDYAAAVRSVELADDWRPYPG